MRYPRLVATAIGISLCALSYAQAQESHWASASDPTAKQLIAWERLWAEAGCTHNGIEKTILADDFLGTAPSGALYSKSEAVTESTSTAKSEESCEMYDVKAHFFGDSLAVLYGSESAIHIAADGHKHRVKLTWTDTWLKRAGKWQLIAVQDMPSEMK